MKQNLVRKIWEEIKWRPSNRKEAIELLIDLVFNVVYYGFVVGFIVYLIYAFQSKSASDVAFQVATISGLLGGLVLSGGLIKDKTPTGVQLKRIGVLFIASTLGFILVGLYGPILDKPPENQMTIEISKRVFQAGLLIGIIGFSLATGFLAVLMPKLWKKDEPK